MQWLAEISVKRPVFASVLVLSLAVVGVFAYFQLGVDLFPKVDFPVITVTTRQSGAAPEEIETEITDKVERAVNTISGIEELRSVSTEGVSQVFIQFKLEKSVDVAAQEVRDKVNQILPDLPQDIDQPVVDKLDPDAAPVLFVSVSADRLHPGHQRIRRQDPPARDRIHLGRRSGHAGRVAAAAGQPLARSYPPPRLRPHCRRGHPSGCQPEPSASRGKPRPGCTGIDRPVEGAGEQRAGVRWDRGRDAGRGPDRPRPGRPRGGRHRGGGDRRKRGRQGRGDPRRPATVGHEHGRSRGRSHETVERHALATARGLQPDDRPGSVRFHQGFGEDGAGTPNRRGHPGRLGRPGVPAQLAIHAHRGDRHPGIHREHLRPHVRHGIHAQHPDPARPDARGRHRDRRRHRRPGEHLPAHGREGPVRVRCGHRGDARNRPGGSRDHLVPRRGVSCP